MLGEDDDLRPAHVDHGDLVADDNPCYAGTGSELFQSGADLVHAGSDLSVKDVVQVQNPNASALVVAR